jgi:hypothetical protein
MVEKHLARDRNLESSGIAVLTNKSIRAGWWPRRTPRG